MHTRRVVCARLAIAAFLASGPLAARAGTTVTWNGASSAWSNGADWLGGIFPTAGYPTNGTPAGVTYDAHINSGAVSVDVGVTVDNLFAAGGTLQGTENITVLNTFFWSNASTLQGSGTITTSNMAINNNGAYLYMGGTGSLVSTGTTTWSSNGGYTVNLAVSNTYTNQGTFDINGTANAGWAGGTFNNQGLINKTATDTNHLATNFNNSGTVSVSAGVLQLAGGGTYTGDMNTSGTGVIDMTGGVHNYNAGASVSSGTLSVSGGTLNFNSNNSIANLNVDGGIVAGAGTAQVSGTLSWSSAAIIQGSGTLTTSNLTIDNRSAYLYMAGTASLVSTGPGSTWLANGGFSVNLGTGNTYTNAGTMTIATAGNPTFNGGAFINQGLLRKTSVDTNTISSPMMNSGTISVSAGDLQLSGGGTYTGDLNTSGNGIIDMTGGLHNFNTGATVSTGTLSASKGTLSLNSAAANSIANLNLDGGVVTGTGRAMVTGTFTWAAAGVIQGSGTLTTSNLIVNNLGAYLYMAGTASLVSTGPGSMWIANGGFSANLAAGNTYTNAGTLTIATAGNPTFNGGTFINQGLLLKTSSDTNIISSPFIDSGSVNVSAGLLQLSGGGTYTGSLGTTAPGVLDLRGGVHVFEAGASVSSGTLTSSGGTINLTSPAANMMSNLALTGGVISGSGNALVTGTLNWGGGSVIGGSGTLTGSNLVINNVGAYLYMNGLSTLVSTGPGSTWVANGGYSANLGTGNTYMNLGTLTITTGGNPTFNGGAIINNGLISKTSGDTNIVTSPMTNGGAISVSAGVLQFASGGTYTGDLSTSGTGVLNLSAGIHNFNAGATVSTGTLTVGGTINFNVANSSLAGFQLLGTAQGAGSANIGTFLWAGNSATIGGSLAIIAANLQIQNVGAYLYMTGTSSLVSTGLGSAWTANGGYSVNLGTANAYTNSGVLSINTSGNPSWVGGTWINTGAITKVSSDTNNVSAVLNNPGTIDVEAGTLNFTHGDGGLTSGTFHAGSGGTLLLGGNFTVSAPGVFSGPGNITVQSGKLTLNQSQRLDDTQFTVSGSLNSWGAVIDVKTKALVFQTTGSPDKATKMTRLLNQTKIARGNNTWTGNGITSSSAIADPTHKAVVVVDNAYLGLTSLDSLPTDASSILVEATYMGDTNLDRKVDVTDLGTLATNYGSSVAGGIVQGDFNNDGKVDVTDLGILATDYGLGTNGQAFTISTASVPEPTSLLLLAAPLALLLRRRARHARCRFAILDS